MIFTCFRPAFSPFIAANSCFLRKIFLDNPKIMLETTASLDVDQFKRKLIRDQYQRLAIRLRIAGLEADVHRAGDESA